MPNVRSFVPADWPAVWRILEPVFLAGETYAVARDIGEVDVYVMYKRLAG